jgi:hypothetical protein
VKPALNEPYKNAEKGEKFNSLCKSFTRIKRRQGKLKKVFLCVQIGSKNQIKVKNHERRMGILNRKW